MKPSDLGWYMLVACLVIAVLGLLISISLVVVGFYQTLYQEEVGLFWFYLMFLVLVIVSVVLYSGAFDKKEARS